MARGFQQYTTSELVETDEINDLFVKQGVLYFADATARDAAFTAAGVSPEEGMHCYLADSKIVQEHNGTAWVFLTSAVYTANGDLAYFNGTKLVRIAPGGSSQVLTMVGGVPAWSTPISGAVVRDGGNLTEASTTSTTQADVLTASSLSIGAGLPLYIVCSFRKTGTNGVASIGLKINSTVLGSVAASGTTSAVTGYAVFEVGPASASYGRGMGRLASDAGLASGALLSALRPNATVTDVTVRGSVSIGGDTVFIDDLHVYSLAAS